MSAKRFTFTMAASDDDAICKSQTPSKAGDLTIDGVLATTVMDMTAYPTASATAAKMDVPRHVRITSAGDDSGATFTLYGSDRAGNVVSEASKGPNKTTVDLTTNFDLVTKVSIDKAAAGAIKVGTANGCETAWIPVSSSPNARPFNVNVETAFGSTANMTSTPQTTMSDVNAVGFVETTATTSDGTGITASARVGYTAPFTAWRAKITSFVAGTLSFVVGQS